MRKTSVALAMLTAGWPCSGLLAAPISQIDIDTWAAAAATLTKQAVDTATILLGQVAAAQTALTAKQAELDAAVKTDAAHIALLEGDITRLTAHRDKLVAAMPAPTVSVAPVPDTITTVGGSSHLKVTGTFLDTCIPTMELDVTPTETTTYTFDCTGLNGTHVIGKAAVTVAIPAPDPTVNSTLVPSAVEAGRAVAYNWKGTDLADGTPCTLTGLLSGDRPGKGSEGFTPGASGKVDISCKGKNGKLTPLQSASVTVNPAQKQPVVNDLIITNVSGTVQKNYPVQAGLPLVRGDIQRSPQALANGTPILTQANVKNRWEDGSVKFVVVSFVVPELPAAGSVTVTFQDQPTGNNTPIASADLLTSFPGFDGVIQITDPTTKNVVSASARQMLIDGACKPWTSGPVAQTMICADDSASAKYDMGFAWKSFRPRFYVTFWPATKQVFVRYVGEISNDQALGAFPYDLALTAGKDSPATVYTQAGIKHSIATRWTRTAWIGGAPEQKINIKHDAGYLADTGLTYMYDASGASSEAQIAAWWDTWQTADKSIGGAGWWRQNMPDPGQRGDIGPNPGHAVVALLTGDWRFRSITLTMADLAGAWPMQVREGNPAKKMDKAQTVSGLGRPASVYAHMTSWGLDLRAPGNDADKYNIVSPVGTYGSADTYNSSGWNPDGAHHPDPFSTAYLLTGDPFYLEEMQFWAIGNGFISAPGACGWCRGPGARIYDQSRGVAWDFRTRSNAWALTPDDDSLKGVLYDQIVDAIAGFEGEKRIKGHFQSHPMWAYGLAQTGEPNPLGWWDIVGGYDVHLDPKYNHDLSTGVLAVGATAHWGNNWIITVVGQMTRMGLPARELFEYVAQTVIWQSTDPAYNPYLQGEYVIPDRRVAAIGDTVTLPLLTPAETLKAWAPNMRQNKDFSVYPDSYISYAAGAAAYIAEVMNRPDVWQKFLDIWAERAVATNFNPDWGSDPRFRLVPSAKK